MNWIFSSFKRDLLFVLAPGHVCLIVLLALQMAGLPSHISAISLLLFIMVDNGHVYTTFARTVKEKTMGEKGAKYLLFVLAYLFVVLALQLKSALLLWQFAFYATYYHYVRQNLGLLIFYQKLNGSADSFNRKALVAFQVLGGLAAHFRPDARLPYYSENDLFSYPNSTLLLACQIIYLTVFGAWALKTWTGRGSAKTAPTLFILSTALLFGYLQIKGVSLEIVLVALIASHGIPYVCLIRSVLADGKNSGRWKVWALIASILAVCGGAEYFANMKFAEVYAGPISLPAALFHSLLLLPLFSHFFFDALIWKGSNKSVQNLMSRNRELNSSGKIKAA